MPHLEAVTIVRGGAPQASAAEPVPPGEYRWRREVPLNQTVRLGRDAELCELGAPSDVQISRFHATLTWTGSELQVERRGILTDFREPTRNDILFRGTPNDKFAIRVGESFQIGQTTFFLRPSDETLPAAPVDGVAPQQVLPKSRSELQEQEFANRELLRAVYRLPNRLAAIKDESALFARVLREVEEALPRADAVGIVRRPPHCPQGELEVQVITYRTRPRLGDPGEFRPSRKLVKKAVCEEERSCLCVWPLGGGTITTASSDMTLPPQGGRPGTVPWAVCAPFQDDSHYALYVAGFEEPLTNGSPDPTHLRDFLKYAELVLQILEAARNTIRLRQQLDLARLAWPTNLRPLLNDPTTLRELLREPKEAEITVLFCDLRGYSKDAEAKGKNLHAAFAEVQKALDVMSSAVTDKGGIVAGFRGDAILGFWGWPEGTGDQIERAASAAARIFTKLLGPINQRKCGLGLTHGTALAGRLGAHDLANVDLYGPIVNLAFRLEEMTKAYGVGIVVSEEIAKRVRTADPAGTHFRMRPLGTVWPRGVNNVLPVHELVPREPVADYPTWLTDPAYNANLRLWKSALDQFTSGSWVAAYAALDDHFDSDPVAKYLMKFMRVSNKTPPIGWDGIHTPKPLD